MDGYYSCDELNCQLFVSLFTRLIADPNTKFALPTSYGDSLKHMWLSRRDITVYSGTALAAVVAACLFSPLGVSGAWFVLLALPVWALCRMRYMRRYNKLIEEVYEMDKRVLMEEGTPVG